MSVVKYHAQITYLAVTVKGYTVEIVQMKGGIYQSDDYFRGAMVVVLTERI